MLREVGCNGISVLLLLCYSNVALMQLRVVSYTIELVITASVSRYDLSAEY
jgi:hypothetical protein